MDEDAIDSMRELQGFPLAGNPLRIEFAKAVSVANLILLVTFPADYMYISQKFNFDQFNSFNQSHNIGLDIKLQNLQQSHNIGLEINQQNLQPKSKAHYWLRDKSAKLAIKKYMKSMKLSCSTIYTLQLRKA